MLNVEREFSLNSKTYGNFDIIQRKVAQKLIGLITDNPATVLDIGCGNGSVYESINWPLKNFVGIDFAEGMLDSHPKNDNVKLFKRDFNHPGCFNDLDVSPYCRVISSSSLQWADNLGQLFQNISNFSAPVSFAVFTSGTFKSLYSTASIPAILRSAEEVINIAKIYFDAEYEVLNYKLHFSSVREMLVYIKKSGVGGARNILSYSQMKNLMNNYPLDHLEFEIVVMHETSCSRR